MDESVKTTVPASAPPLSGSPDVRLSRAGDDAQREVVPAADLEVRSM
jgi:hypothetical protein